MQYKYIAEQGDWDRSQDVEKKLEEFLEKHEKEFASIKEAKDFFIDNGLW